MTKTFLAVAAFALLTSASLSGYAASPSQPAAAPASVAAAVGVVNLNTADARAIAAYREEHGPFSSLDELLEVKGIGVSTLEQNRGKLSLQ